MNIESASIRTFARLSPLPQNRSAGAQDHFAGPQDRIELSPPPGNEDPPPPTPPKTGRLGKLLLAGLGLVGAVGGGAALFNSAPQAQVQLQKIPSQTWMTTAEEQELGRQAAQELEKQTPVWTDAEANRRVNELGARLALVSTRSDIEYRFKLLDSPQVNALSLPGGHIYVTRGMYEKYPDDAELTFILGHEMAHVEQRHAVERLNQTVLRRLGTLPMLLKQWPTARSAFELGDRVIGNRYAQAQEQEADQLGQQYLVSMGMDPHKAVDAMVRLQSLQKHHAPPVVERIFSDHPPTPERIEALRQGAANVSPGP